MVEGILKSVDANQISIIDPILNIPSETKKAVDFALQNSNITSNKSNFNNVLPSSKKIINTDKRSFAETLANSNTPANNIQNINIIGSPDDCSKIMNALKKDNICMRRYLNTINQTNTKMFSNN